MEQKVIIDKVLTTKFSEKNGLVFNILGKEYQINFINLLNPYYFHTPDKDDYDKLISDINSKNKANLYNIVNVRIIDSDLIEFYIDKESYSYINLKVNGLLDNFSILNENKIIHISNIVGFIRKLIANIIEINSDEIYFVEKTPKILSNIV
ncbi:hypothetical protein FPHOBKDP_00075 [Listeria phage LPJP1]|nr:hypothetical protein FPHOBKDP_00075 [Listeria phage LPJP1]